MSVSVHSLFKVAYFLCEIDGEIRFSKEEVVKIFGRLLTFIPDSLTHIFLSLSLSPSFFSFFFFREKYMNIILKMEEMLKSWFPNVKLQDQLAATQTEEAVPTKKPKVKLHLK